MRHSRVGLGVQQAWGPDQDVICPPGSCGGGGQFPPGVRVSLVQLHQGGLQGGHFVVLQIEGWRVGGTGAPTPLSATRRPPGAPQAPLSCLGLGSSYPSRSTPVPLHPSLCSWWGSPAILFMPKSSGCPLLTHPWLLHTPATSLLWPGGPQAKTSPHLKAASSL